MKTAVAAVSKAAGLAFNRSLLEAFAVNEQAHQLLLGNIVPGFKPDVVNFVAYLIAHDSHHRGQIAMLTGQVGYGIPAQAGFGLWEWRTLWRECGFGK